MRGLSGAQIEMGLAAMVYNLKRITNILGVTKLTEALQHPDREVPNNTT